MKTFQIMRIDHTIILTSNPPQQAKKPVAEGIIFNSGKVVINWLGDIASVVVHDNIENVIKIHCNGDSSLIQYGHDSNSVVQFNLKHECDCSCNRTKIPIPGAYSQAIGSGALTSIGYGSVAIGPGTLKF